MGVNKIIEDQYILNGEKDTEDGCNIVVSFLIYLLARVFYLLCFFTKYFDNVFRKTNVCVERFFNDKELPTPWGSGGRNCDVLCSCWKTVYNVFYSEIFFSPFKMPVHLFKLTIKFYFLEFKYRNYLTNWKF